jgi:hypothetical protein
MSYTKETIAAVLANDLNEVWRKDVEYARSWQARGGFGAFMMLARKWDRLEAQIKRADAPFSMDGGRPPSKYDIFEHIEADTRPEGIIDDIRDLRRYLALVEAEMVARDVVQLSQTKKTVYRPMPPGVDDARGGDHDDTVRPAPSRSVPRPAARTEHPAPHGYNSVDDGPI